MWEKTRNLFLESIERTLAAIVGFLPALLAMAAVLVVSVLFAWLMRSVLRRLLVRVKLDQWLRSWGVAAPAAEGRTPPSENLARLGFWLVVAFGFLIGASAFDSTGAIAKELLAYVPRAVVGLIMFVAGLAGSRAIERGVLIGAVNAGLQSARLLGLGARWLVVVLSAAMALEQLGLGGTVLVVSFSILFGGIVLALALAVGLGARQTVARSLERVFNVATDKAAPPAEKSAEAPAADEYHHM